MSELLWEKFTGDASFDDVRAHSQSGNDEYDFSQHDSWLRAMEVAAFENGLLVKQQAFDDEIAVSSVGVQTDEIVDVNAYLSTMNIVKFLDKQAIESENVNVSATKFEAVKIQNNGIQSNRVDLSASKTAYGHWDAVTKSTIIMVRHVLVSENTHRLINKFPRFHVLVIFRADELKVLIRDYFNTGSDSYQEIEQLSEDISNQLGIKPGNNSVSVIKNGQLLKLRFKVNG